MKGQKDLLGGYPLVIWGAGAMGGSIGAALQREGVEVLFVDKVLEHIRAINHRGLRISGPVADYSVAARAVHASDLAGSFPVIFLCVKAHHTSQAMNELASHLDADGFVVSIQNGLCELEIAERLGQSRTVGAFVNFGADYMGPGVIHRGNRGAVVVGEMDGSMTPRVREVHGLLRLFEPGAVLTENIMGYLWGKLAYASLLFATALTDDSIAEILDEEAFRPILTSLARETVSVALGGGVRLEGFDGFDPEAFFPDEPDVRAEESLDRLVAFNRASAKTHSGIWRDLAVRKRPTEVDAQLGWVVRLGEERVVPTPLTRALIRQIHEIESGARRLSRGNLYALGEGI